MRGGWQEGCCCCSGFLPPAPPADPLRLTGGFLLWAPEEERFVGGLLSLSFWR